MRIAILGGSGVATPALIDALVERFGPSTPVTVVLQGRTVTKLQRVAAACQGFARGSGVTVEAETDLRRAITGADIVFNQVRVGGLEGRASDEQFPTRLGLIGDEALGAGGFADAVRTIPVAVNAARLTAELAPAALFFNFSNPSSLVQQAIQRAAPGLTVVSACDVPVTMAGWVGMALGEPHGPLEVDYFGTNHIGWIWRVREGGRDRLHEVLAHLERIPGFPVDPGFVRDLGVLPGPFLRLYYHRDRHLPKGPIGRSRASKLLELEARLLAAYEGSDLEVIRKLVRERNPHWYHSVVAPLMAAWAGLGPMEAALQVSADTAPLAPGMARESVLEVPCRVDRGRIQPLARGSSAWGSLPRDCRALFWANAVYEEMAVEAILHRNRELARRALVSNPLVGSLDAAEAVLQTCWETE